MKLVSSYRLRCSAFGFLVGLALPLSVLMSSSSAHQQQEVRQLNREQSQEANRVSQPRIALIIGNGAYQNVQPLKNPPNDATLLAATLKRLGFEVTVGTDKSQREMKRLIREFGQQLRAGGGVGLFYFAGHGIQARGRNYLIPVDADIQTEADLEDVAVDVNYVLNMMDDAQNALNIAILDACRNNPFARSFRSAQEGLAQVKAPTGTLIAYATAPDSVAADGGGPNSPYAEELTKQIQLSGMLLETMFRRVAEQVSSRSGGRQEPWYSANVKGDFYFSVSPTSSLSNNGDITQSTKIDAVAVEREYWETIRTSNEVQNYKDYLQTYPYGSYANIARAKIRQIETSQCTEVNKAVWYKIFNQNRTTKAEVAYEAGKKYLTACPDELSDVAEYLKKWVAAYEGPNTISSETIKVSVKAFDVELQSCKMSTGEVVCELILTNTSAADKEFDLCHDDYRVVRRGKDVTRATDNAGNRYAIEESVIGGARAGKGLFGKAVLPPQVPLRMTLKFDNVAATSSSFSLLRLAIYERGTGNPDLMMYADFKNVPIQR